MFLIHNKPEQADLLASALVAVHRPDNKWYVPAQENLAHTLFLKLLKKDIDFNSHPAISPEEVAKILNFSNERTELLELLVAFEMLCSPIPKKLEYEIDTFGSDIQHTLGSLGGHSAPTRRKRNVKHFDDL